MISMFADATIENLPGSSKGECKDEFGCLSRDP